MRIALQRPLPIYLVCAIALAFLGCQPTVRRAEESSVGSSPRQLTLLEAERLLRTNASQQHMLALLGSPALVEKHGEVAEVWSYPTNPILTTNSGGETYIVEVIMLITNGALADLDYSYMDSPAATENTHVDQADPNEQSEQPTTLEFFVIPGDLSSDDALRATEDYSNFDPPSLTVTRLVDARYQEREQPTGGTRYWSFSLKLTPEDGQRLQSVTSSNVGQRLLVTLNRKPLTAPRIVAPLTSDSIMIDCDKPELKGLLEYGLNQMIDKGL